VQCGLAMAATMDPLAPNQEEFATPGGAFDCSDGAQSGQQSRRKQSSVVYTLCAVVAMIGLFMVVTNATPDSMAKFVARPMPGASIPTGRASVGFDVVRRSDPFMAIEPPPIKVPVVDYEGKVTGSKDVQLLIANKGAFVVHQLIRTESANLRSGTAHCKTRAEVSGGGKKPYQQKGSGNARRGSSRSPLIRGGGKSHGPRFVKDRWKLKMNKRAQRIAMSTALMGAMSRTQIISDDFQDKFTEPKTKQAVNLLRDMKVWPREEHILVVVKNKKEEVLRSLRNIQKLKYVTPQELTGYDIVLARKLVITEKALNYIEWRYSRIFRTRAERIEQTGKGDWYPGWTKEQDDKAIEENRKRWGWDAKLEDLPGYVGDFSDCELEEDEAQPA